MIIDTHNHVGLAPLAQSLEVLAQKASAMGVVCGVITAGGVEDFERVRQTAQKLNWGYCVGLHPLYIRENWQADIKALSAFLETHQDDPHLVGIGEIGLDFYVEGLDRDRQEAVFKEELQLALRFNLPVSIHGRRALYRVLALMKEYPTVSGVLHAFAGSLDEMKQAVRRGLYLGMGGAMTFPGSKRVRTAAIQAPFGSLVLETDAPDMPPVFSETKKSSPLDLPRYLSELADLRQEDESVLSKALFMNSLSAFPKLKVLLAK